MEGRPLCRPDLSDGTEPVPPLRRESRRSDASSTHSASPSSTSIFFSDATTADLKRFRGAAMTSAYAFTQVAHPANNSAPPLSGSIQAAQAVEYVPGEMKSLGCDVQ